MRRQHARGGQRQCLSSPQTFQAPGKSAEAQSRSFAAYRQGEVAIPQTNQTPVNLIAESPFGLAEGHHSDPLGEPVLLVIDLDCPRKHRAARIRLPGGFPTRWKLAAGCRLPRSGRSATPNAWRGRRVGLWRTTDGSNPPGTLGVPTRLSRE